MPFQATFGNASLKSFGLGATRRRIGAPISVQYLVVAGGGGSNQSWGGQGGAGGAGGLRTGTTNTSGGIRMSIMVGGGAVWPDNGGNSSITATEGVWTNVSCWGGGSGGADASLYGPLYEARPGGSGGGGRTYKNVFGGNGAAGTPGEGNDGGGGLSYGSVDCTGGGGGAGGAGGTGSAPPGVPAIGGSAGAAYTSSISGTPADYAGGGQGSGNSLGSSAAPGGLAGQSAPANGGGGAGACGSGTLSGGSGIVILRSVVRASNTVGSPTETQVGNEWIYTFTGSGQIVIGTV